MALRLPPLAVIFLGGCLFLLDRFLKYQALSAWNFSYLFKDFIGWSPFLNPGIAFSLPLSAFVTSLITAPILIIVGYVLLRILTGRSPLPEAFPFPMPASSIIQAVCAIFLFVGAASNLIDRLIYGYVIDYFRIATGIINIADLLIATGFTLYLWKVTTNPAKAITSEKTR